MRGNPPLRTPPPHSQCLCRSWHCSRSRVSSGLSTGVVGDWVTRRREVGEKGERERERERERGGNRERKAKEGGKKRVRRG